MKNIEVMKNIEEFLKKKFTQEAIDQAQDFIIDLQNAEGSVLECGKEKYKYSNGNYYFVQKNREIPKTENLVLAGAAFNITNLIKEAQHEKEKNLD